MSATEQLLVQIDASTEQLRRQLRAADQGVQRFSRQTDTSLRSIDNRFTRLGQSATRLASVFGLTLGAAGVQRGFTAIIQEGEEARQSMMRLEAALAAAGDQSGVTASQVLDMASRISRQTLATSGDLETAAQRLIALGVTGEDNFERILRTGQDMAAAFGSSVTPEVERLAQALDDPARRLTTLERQVGAFDSELRRNIISMAEAGDQAGATDAVLAELERRVGGVGGSEASGLTGATSRLSEEWGTFLQRLNETTGAAASAQAAIESLSRFLGQMSDGPLTGITESTELDVLRGQRRAIEASMQADIQAAEERGAEVGEAFLSGYRDSLAEIDRQIFAIEARRMGDRFAGQERTTPLPADFRADPFQDTRPFTIRPPVPGERAFPLSPLEALREQQFGRNAAGGSAGGGAGSSFDALERERSEAERVLEAITRTYERHAMSRSAIVCRRQPALPEHLEIPL